MVAVAVKTPQISLMSCPNAGLMPTDPGAVESPRHRFPTLPIMTETASAPSLSADTWNQQLDQLRVRYPHARPAILVALNILLHDKDIADDDAKARASLHGARITAASLSAARTLLSRMDAPTVAAEPATAAASAPTPARAVRRPRAADQPLDAASMIQSVVARLQEQGNAEADRLRDSIRKAIAMLQAAVGGAS